MLYNLCKRVATNSWCIVKDLSWKSCQNIMKLENVTVIVVKLAWNNILTRGKPPTKLATPAAVWCHPTLPLLKMPQLPFILIRGHIFIIFITNTTSCVSHSWQNLQNVYDLGLVAIPEIQKWTVIQYKRVTGCISVISSVASYPSTFT